jgi:hypothetical protein
MLARLKRFGLAELDRFVHPLSQKLLRHETSPRAFRNEAEADGRSLAGGRRIRRSATAWTSEAGELAVDRKAD